LVKGINQKGKGKQKRLQKLLNSICLQFENFRTESSSADLLLNKIYTLDSCQNIPSESSKNQPIHEKMVRNAIDQSKDQKVAEIIKNLEACITDLTWREDKFEFYPQGSNLGARYCESNLHTQIIGPKGSLIQTKDLMVGLFTLGSWTLYRDHHHEAPELYLNLSEKSAWRFNFGEWQNHCAGSLIWNPGMQTHATICYEKPFLAIFAWLESINSVCEVVASDDHLLIEEQLYTLSMA